MTASPDQPRPFPRTGRGSIQLIGGLGIWVRAEWRNRWRALVGIAVIAAIGGGLTLAAAAGARRADTAVDRFLIELGAPISVSANSSAMFDAEPGTSADLARQISKVTGVRGVRQATWLGVALQDGDEPLYFFSVALGDAVGDDPPASVRVTEGRLPDHDATDEVAVTSAAAAVIGAEVGDIIELRSYAADQLELFVRDDGGVDNGPRVQVEVVGLATTAEDLGEGAGSIAFLSAAFAEAHRDDIAMCDCALFVNAAPGEIAEVTDAIRAEVDEREVFVTSENAYASALVDDAIGVEVGTLWIATAVAGAAGLLVVALAIGRHIATSSGARSSLEAIGVTRWSLVRAWTMVFGPVAVTGALGAMAIAVAASPLFPRGLAREAEPDPGVRVDLATLGSGAVLMIVAVVAAAFALAFRATASPAVVNERVPTRHTWPITWLSPSARLGCSLAIDPGRQGNRLTFTSAVTGLAVAVGGVLAITMIERSIDDVLATPSAYGADWDLQLMKAPRDPEAFIAATLEQPIDALALQTTALTQSFVLRGPSGTAAIQPVAYESITGAIGPFIDEGRPLADDDDIVVSHDLAVRIGVGLGDEVVFEPGGEAFTVGGFGRTYNDNDDSESSVVITPDGMVRLNNGDEPQALGGFVRIGDADATVRAHLYELGWQDSLPPSRVGNLGQIGTVPRLLAIALGVLGFAGVLNGLLVAISRRRLDLAVTRALGFTPAQTVAAVVWQACAITATAVVIGVPLGALVGRLVWKRVVEGVGAIDLVSVPWSAIVLVPAGTLIVMVVVGAVVGRRTTTLRPARVLRRE